MAQAATHQQMSAVRKQHAAHPHRPKPASKPGEPDSATARAAAAGRPAMGRARRVREPVPRRRKREEEGRLPARAHGVKPRARQDAPPRGQVGRASGVAEFGLPEPHLSIWTRLARKLLRRLAKHELRKLAKAAGKRIGTSLPTRSRRPGMLEKPREALEKPREALERSREALGLGSPPASLPIQQSVDMAVPLILRGRSGWSSAPCPRGSIKWSKSSATVRS